MSWVKNFLLGIPFKSGHPDCPNCFGDGRYDCIVWGTSCICPCRPEWRVAKRVLMSIEDNPVPVTIYCPKCETMHLDDGEWATRPHKTHLCLECGQEWRPFPYATVGVDDFGNYP